MNMNKYNLPEIPVLNEEEFNFLKFIDNPVEYRYGAVNIDVEI